MKIPPERLVTSGPYAWCRNPMYLGHVIFLLGLTLTLQSLVALALLVVTVVLLQRHVLEDEKRLRALFGADYEAYAARVTRWIPRLF